MKNLITLVSMTLTLAFASVGFSEERRPLQDIMRYQFTPVMTILQAYAKGKDKKVGPKKIMLDGKLNDAAIIFSNSNPEQSAVKLLDWSLQGMAVIEKDMKKYGAPDVKPSDYPKVEQYAKMMKQLTTDFSDLKKAFAGNDLAAASELINKINSLKGDAHDQFKPQSKDEE